MHTMTTSGRSQLLSDERGMETIQAVLLLALAALVLIGLAALWDRGDSGGIRGRTVALLDQVFQGRGRPGSDNGAPGGSGTGDGAFDDPAAEGPIETGSTIQPEQEDAETDGAAPDGPPSNASGNPGGGATSGGGSATDSDDQPPAGAVPGTDDGDPGDAGQDDESPWVKEIDIREQLEPESRYLVFSARPGLPGHAFVVWGTEDEQLQMSTAEAFGLYPDPSLWNQFEAFTFGRVPGRIADEAVRGRPGAETVRLIVRVDSRQYALAEQIRAEWDAKGEYKLLQRDCISFTAQIARALGLRTPSRGVALPEEFMQQVVELNTQ